MPAGRPSKFTKELEYAMIHLATLGYTDKQISTACGVTEQTLNNWKISHPEFFESLKEAKITPDQLVEASLFQRATGYSAPETKMFLHRGKIVSQDMIKHYPPDPTSMIFWLKNRQPKLWKEKHEVNHLTDGNPIQITYVRKSDEKT